MYCTQIVFVSGDGADVDQERRFAARIRACAARFWRPCQCHAPWLKIEVGGRWQEGVADELGIMACCFERLVGANDGLSELKTAHIVPSCFTNRSRFQLSHRAA